MFGAAERSFRELDDLVLRLKGLVLVRRLREQRGADAGELVMYATEIDRVREQLAILAKTGGLDNAAARRAGHSAVQVEPAHRGVATAHWF